MARVANWRVATLAVLTLGTAWIEPSLVLPLLVGAVVGYVVSEIIKR